MTSDISKDEILAELKEVESDLVSVRRNAAEMRDGLGDEEDPADRGARIQAADEQDNIAEQLTARRETLLRRIAES